MRGRTAHQADRIVPYNDTADFSTLFNGLALNDEIAVAVAANGDIGFDTFALDYCIALLTSEFSNHWNATGN